MPYTEQLKIRTSDCDKNLKITPSSVLDLFQETAGRHCIPYKLDSPTLIQDKDSTWVLSGMALKFDKYPKWPESLIIDTWTKRFKGFKALRDYSANNENGEKVIIGSSVWALINLETRRPTKLEILNSDILVETDNNLLSDITPGKPDIYDNYNDDDYETLIVTKTDLDLNNHVSNIQYINWMYAYLKNDFLDCFELSFINIAYKGETYLGDELIFKTVIINNKGYHCFINKKTNKDICVISSEWREVV